MKCIVSCSFTDRMHCSFAVFWLKSTRMCWAESLLSWSSIRGIWCPVFPSSTCVTWLWWWDLYNINKYIAYFPDEICIAKKLSCCEIRFCCCEATNSCFSHYIRRQWTKASSVLTADTVFLLGQQPSKWGMFAPYLSVLSITLDTSDKLMHKRNW